MSRGNLSIRPLHNMRVNSCVPLGKFCYSLFAVLSDCYSNTKNSFFVIEIIIITTKYAMSKNIFSKAHYLLINKWF